METHASSVGIVGRSLRAWMFKRFGYIKISAMERNMGRKASGAGRPFCYGLSADTRMMEGGPPLVLKGDR